MIDHESYDEWRKHNEAITPELNKLYSSVELSTKRAEALLEKLRKGETLTRLEITLLFVWQHMAFFDDRCFRTGSIEQYRAVRFAYLQMVKREMVKADG